ncbi:MAG: ABC transporter permease subunit [Candidatus Nitrosopolaris sp.]
MEITIIALAALVTFGRVLLLILVAIFSGWILGYLAIKNRVFENAFVLFVSVFESIPVFSFIPIILIIFIRGLGGGLGVEVAADFLVFTAIVWNIWIGIYQAFKTVPEHLQEVSANYGLGFVDRMRFLYIPYSIPRIAGNIFPSFSDALFYITVSEVFTVGSSSYQTFGIGTLIAQLTAHSDLVSVYYSLIFIAIGVVSFTFLFSKFSRQAIAKYGVNTNIDIQRSKRQYYLPHWMSHGYSRAWYDSLRSQTRGISRYASKMMPIREHRIFHLPTGFGGHHSGFSFKATAKYLTVAVVSIGLIFILYSVLQIVFSVPKDQWSSFLESTPYLLYAMAADYLRVLIVTMASLILAIFLGYFLTIHKKAVPVSLPFIQIIAAFPAPAYFPLIYAITLPFLHGVLGDDASTEFYVLLLCFISTFYYVFFNFWVGIQAIPTEFWEVMRNHELKVLTSLRRIILPATFPYLIAGLSSTINSAWGGLAVAEYWPNIYGNHTLQVHVGMMKLITSNVANGHTGIAAWTSLLFAIVVIIFGIIFTRNLMDLARKKYVVEEGIYQA